MMIGCLGIVPFRINAPKNAIIKRISNHVIPNLPINRYGVNKAKGIKNDGSSRDLNKD
jgi:hypothetical protein